MPGTRSNIERRLREAEVLECRIVAHRCLFTGLETSPVSCGGLLPGLNDILVILVDGCQQGRARPCGLYFACLTTVCVVGTAVAAALNHKLFLERSV